MTIKWKGITMDKKSKFWDKSLNYETKSQTYPSSSSIEPM